MSSPQLSTSEAKLADTKKLLSLPRIVVICGSTRFMTEMNEADVRESTKKKIVVKPGCNMKPPHELWSNPVEAEALKVVLDDLHRGKIRLADEVLVVNVRLSSLAPRSGRRPSRPCAVHRRVPSPARVRTERTSEKRRVEFKARAAQQARRDEETGRV